MAPKSKKTSEPTYEPNIPIIARMFERWTLELVVELVLAISNDFVQRPRHYRNIPPDVADILAEFKTIGSQPSMPTGRHRTAIYGALLGRTEFRDGSAALRDSAIAFVNETEPGRLLTRQNFVDRARSLASYLEELEGQSLKTGNDRTKGIFDKAVLVLKCTEVGGVFGLPPAPDGDWPIGGQYSGEAAYLIEEIARTLTPLLLRTASKSPLKFVTVQQVAHYGALTISGILDGCDDWTNSNQIDQLIGYTYRWAKSIELLEIDTLRAWEDPNYRQSLIGSERALIPPHPSGEMQSSVDVANVDLAGLEFAGGLAFAGQTITSGDDICCSAPTLEAGCDTVTASGKICCSSGQQCDTTTQTHYCTWTCKCMVA